MTLLAMSGIAQQTTLLAGRRQCRHQQAEQHVVVAGSLRLQARCIAIILFAGAISRAEAPILAGAQVELPNTVTSGPTP